ncbi:thioredoxin 2 [Halteromyces radiatus]|uniref:thioredoxin 2 n=1 Tax=Halteromyces radiatus TaxID=101107 RepID=UPI002220267D|nr:thioredoxin 2 [Halteromyces radiatus]KAI8088984.1 thioredoxin 2 [Halteromyces radiatus]
MNSLRIASRSLPLRGIRTFHTNLPRFTGKTIEVDSDSFKSSVLEANHPVLVDFYADWCAPCKMLGPILTKAVADNGKVSLMKIDTDKYTDIAQKYKIAALPTVLAFHNGEVVDQFVGMRNKSQVATFVESHADRAS